MDDDNFKERTKKFLQGARNSVYKGVANLEQKVENREGLVGDIANVVEKTVQQGKNINKKVQESGGYLKLATDTIDKALDKMEKLYDSVDEKLFTDGKFDKDKARQLASDGKSCVQMYGAKAGKVIIDLSKNVGNKVYQNYRDLIPSKEERDTKYAGIGSRWSGLLLRPNYDDCLLFYEHAKKVMPTKSKYRNIVLDDIKASASTDASDLKKFYKNVEEPEIAARKNAIISKYLQN